MRVIGTAGHVDHGKSTLVRALSGIDPDRLREEKARGMTIDLGFAWLQLPLGEDIGIVDVPGHIDFIKNMLAGVGSVDAALLVVAADEGTMPQTQEHLDILHLLQVPAGVVALTKTDLIDDPDWLELVQADLRETLAGTCLATAPLIPVSAATGAGIDDLLQTLSRQLQQTPPRSDKGRPRLFVDRIFTVSGFGTVVTGTLIDGSFKIGDEVEILPRGLRARIRGLQSHQQQVEQARPGSRVAINLTGVGTDALHRGDVVTVPGWLEASQLIDTQLHCLPTAPRPLKHNQQVDIFTGAAEVPGHLRLLGDQELQPGETGWVQLRLQHRIPVVKGDHFIIRQPSPSVTIGGGEVVDPLPRRRHRRFRAAVLERLAMLSQAEPETLVLAAMDQHGPLLVRDVPAAAGLSPEQTQLVLNDLLIRAVVFRLGAADECESVTKIGSDRGVIASVVGWEQMAQRFRAGLHAYHQTNPLRVGISRGELKSRLALETGLFNRCLEQAAQEGWLVAAESLVHLSTHQPTFSPEQQAAVEALLARFAADPFGTPSFKESLAALGGEEALLNVLLETKRLLRLNADVLLLPDTFAEFLTWLQSFVREHGAVTVAQVRDAFQTSRKYALALLEYTDAQRITRREGDERVLVTPARS